MYLSSIQITLKCEGCGHELYVAKGESNNTIELMVEPCGYCNGDTQRMIGAARAVVEAADAKAKG
jgi:hypothetical protein